MSDSQPHSEMSQSAVESQLPVSHSRCPTLFTDHRSLITVHWLLITFFAALAVRLALWLLYAPVTYSDTNAYRRLAQAILNGFQGYDGTRTPGYPAFLALMGSDTAVWLAQMALGVAITLLLFYLGWQMTGSAAFGAVAALAHTLNLGQLFFEANLLSETLATFFVVLTAAGMARWLTRPEKRSLWLAAGMGLACALALLTRAMFVYLPVLVGAFILFNGSGRNEGRQRLTLNVKRLLAFVLPILILVGGWAVYIRVTFGEWGLSAMTGYHLIQHTGVFFEYVPDEYAALRDTYLKYRAERLAEYGSPTNAIWDAIPEMQQVSGLNFYDLSRTLARISGQLIREHPDLYARNLLKGWWYFWRAPVYWSPDALRVPGPAGAVSPLVLAERALLFGANMLFLLLSGWMVIRPTTGDRRPAQNDRQPPTADRERSSSAIRHRSSVTGLFLTLAIWLGSLVQTILDHGDNPRFLIPLQSLLLLWVLWFLWRTIPKLWQNQRSASTADH